MLRAILSETITHPFLQMRKLSSEGLRNLPKDTHLASGKTWMESK